ncbi:MAG: LysM peptidoglycan-binding domain-containing protein [bacterium]|nr:LysM peptidoglycan-binding domain-containing protein [bacterium]
MKSKVRAVLSGLGACGALGLFLVGVPVCLVVLVGNPLPATVPAWSSVVAVVEDGAVPAEVVGAVLAVAVWIWWSQVALSFAAEVLAASRGRTARALPLRGLGMQPIVVRLVAVVLAATGGVGALAQPVLASTPSFAEIAVPMASATGEPPGENGDEAPFGGTAPPVAVAGWPPAPTLGPPEVAVFAVESGLPVPVLRSPGESQPAWSRARLAPDPGSATSARWDPVIDSRLAAPAERAPAAGHDGAGWIIVKPGDSLWLLAEQHLGDALRWSDIFELNVGQLAGGGTLRDPNLIYPGWRLQLPQPDQPGFADPEGATPSRAPAGRADPAGR